MSTPPTSAVVVGAGIIGCSIALELSRRGWAVTVVDKGSTPGCGSTSASSAMVRFNYDNLQEAVLAWESYARWVEWGKHLGVEDPAGLATYVRTGLLVLDGELLDRSLELGHMDTLGIPYESVTAEQIRERHPGLDPARLGPACRVEDDHFWDDPTGEIGGFVQHDSGFVNDATLAAHNLAYAAEQSGATFRGARRWSRCSATASGSPGSGSPTAATCWASVVVNAAGPWSVTLNTMAGVLDDFSTSTRATEQEVISVPAPACVHPRRRWHRRPRPRLRHVLPAAPRGHDHRRQLRGAVRPVDPGRRRGRRPHVTVTGELGGAESAPRPSAARPPGARARSRASSAPTTSPTTGSRSTTGPRSAGYYVAIGTSGHQFKAAPFVGVAMAELIGAVEGGLDHDNEPARREGRVHRGRPRARLLLPAPPRAAAPPAHRVGLTAR